MHVSLRFLSFDYFVFIGHIIGMPAPGMINTLMEQILFLVTP